MSLINSNPDGVECRPVSEILATGIKEIIGIGFAALKGARELFDSEQRALFKDPADPIVQPTDRIAA